MENNRKNYSNKKTSNSHKKKKRKPKYPRIIGWSIALLIVICIIAFFIRLAVWDRGIAYVIPPDTEVILDTKDNVILMPPSIIAKDTYDGKTTVLIFGNDSYAEGIDSKNSIIDYMAEDIPDVEFINCCLPGSGLNSLHESALSPSECPEDYFTLFWLSFDLCWNDFSKEREALLYLDPSVYDLPRYEEVITTLESVDLSSVDVVMFCYDGHDYRNGRLPVNYVGADAQTENIETLLGALNTSVYLFNNQYPDMQYVYVSPSFCYAIDENGDKISCAILDTGNGTIAETFNAARLISNYYGVSYIDMYSGVLINEENGEDYLEDDGITPNKKARRLMADRLVKLLEARLVNDSSSDTKGKK